MIHGYHIVMPMYGFWLPNDPRGSWSEFVRQWELVRYGKAKQTIERKETVGISTSEMQKRDAAVQALTYPAVSIDGRQALAIANGFAAKIKKCKYTIWACSILPDHTHLVIARHSYKVEHIVNLLKGASTKRIIEEGRHPLAVYAASGLRPPRMWAARGWKAYLDSEQAIENAISYVEENPEKEGKHRQEWSFVTPFAGIPKSGWLTYH